MANALYIMQCSLIFRKESKTMDTKERANAEEWKLLLLPQLSDCNVFESVCISLFACMCMYMCAATRVHSENQSGNKWQTKRSILRGVR